MIDEITRLMRLLEFSDSAFPVGTFSFSNGLETAAFEGIVYDVKTVPEFPIRIYWSLIKPIWLLMYMPIWK